MNTLQESLVIFVVGNSRSGTTMMGRILGREDQVFTFGELHFFGQLIDPDEASTPVSIENAIRLTASLFDIQRNGLLKKRNVEPYYNEASQLVNESQPKTGFDVYFNFLHYETRKHNKTIPCDQTPGNLYAAQQILNHYANARFVHMIRDPRDILLSQKLWPQRRKLGGTFVSRKVAFRMWCNYHPITMSKLWNGIMRTADKIKDDRIINLRFEDLLISPPQEVKRLCDWLKINFSEDLLSVPQVGSSLKMDEPGKTGIDGSRTSSWKKGGLNSTEIYLCETISKEWMKKMNYLSSGESVNNLTVLWYYLTWPVKLFMALMMNINRNRNILKTIRRRFSNT
jgi:omega-hydroxy-beta-dihydromenaquinone-9 sulfotransferase